MSLINFKDDSSIKELIEKQHANTQYTYDEMVKIIQDISLQINKDATIVENIILFVYYTNKKYSFNHNKKHKATKKYHEKILSSFKEKEVEPTSEELAV